MNAKLQSAADQLPVQLTSFVGREREIAAVRGALAGARLLTLTGAGGSGKTRLALAVAAQLAPAYDEGVVWVELASLPDGDRLANHVAATLGIRDNAGRPPVEVLVQALHGRSRLLVLDNCEHLAQACAMFADTLLRACAGLTILATSREALGVAGERAWLVPPLTLPAEGDRSAPEQLMGFEAVQLFAARACDAVPGFLLTEANAAAVAQICRRLDGLPLAIELAAARVRVLAPEQIAQRLDNVFALLTGGSRTALPRQRTLRATIDWSYQLLSGPEQLLLQRLSAFAGGFTLEAAEAVCGDERLEAGEVLDLLARLVDRSLVVMREQDGAARYHLLETVRQYAAERWAATESRDGVHGRHAMHYLRIAEAAAPHLFAGAASPQWMQTLDHEYANLGVAGEWFLTRPGDDDGALRLFAALHWYWFARGRIDEARSRLEAAIARAGEAPPLARAAARCALANVALWQADHGSVGAMLGDAVETLRSMNERRLLSYALVPLGWSRMVVDPHEAYAILREAVALSRSDRPDVLTAVTLYWLAFAAQAVGEEEFARDALDEAVALGRAVRHRPGIAHPLTARGRLAIMQGDAATAVSCLTEALLIHEQTEDRWGMVIAIETLADVAQTMGDPEWAAGLWGAAAAIRERIGLPRAAADPRAPVALFGALRRTLGDERFARCEDAGRTLTPQLIVHRFAPAADGAAPALPATPSRAPAGTPAPQSAPALRVQALGRLTIERDGEVLPPDAWPYSKPRELLLYLLVHPQGRSREQIGLAFWPDASPAQVKNSFHVTLHHLRKVLGHADWIVFEDERYRIRADLGVEFDAALFEQQTAAALAAARAGSGSIDALRSALGHYHGDFLQDEPAGDWHLELRDQLGRTYIEGLLALGALLMAAERFVEAADVYQRIVVKEDLHEDAHRRLMRCLAHSGERARALRHYERLTVLLRDELDAEPEHETTALFERLKLAEPI